MGRMIRIELYRAFHGKELKAAMLLGGLLGLAHFALEVVPSVSHIFDGYHPDIASSVVGNVTESWMGGMINPFPIPAFFNLFGWKNRINSDCKHKPYCQNHYCTYYRCLFLYV